MPVLHSAVPASLRVVTNFRNLPNWRRNPLCRVAGWYTIMSDGTQRRPKGDKAMTTTATTATTATTVRTEGEQVLAECRRLVQLLWREVESATSASGQRFAMKRYLQAIDVYEQTIKLYPEAWGR